MFDVGFAELFLLALIGLIILGPERLPRVARTLGGLVRKARTSWFALRRSIEAELAAAEVAEPIKSAGKELEDVARQINEIDLDAKPGEAKTGPDDPVPDRKAGQAAEPPDG